MSEGRSKPVRSWQPVEPELTNFHDIISLDFDIATDRGTSDMYVPVTTRPAPGESFPWQRLLLTFWGGPLDNDHHHAIPVRVIFEGVVLFRFLQDDFEPKIGDPAVEHDVFDRTELQVTAGYSHRDDLPDSMGAFCLWECSDSPLVDQLIARWHPGRPWEERRPWLRHFMTSCNELGDFEIVAGDLTIERLPPDSYDLPCGH